MGMATSTQGAHSSINDINVTPMIDVLLVLLIIFMITQPLSRMTLRVQVPPPPQPTATPPAQSNQIVLEMPDNLNTDVEMTTVSGGLESDWPMTMNGRRFSRRNLSGRIGTGGRELKLTTVSGDVELRKVL